MFSADKIKELVQTKFSGATVEVRDTTGTMDHFELLVVSQAFEGKGPVQRHRMVYEAIGAAVGAEIHALSLRTFTPAEFGKE